MEQSSDKNHQNSGTEGLAVDLRDGGRIESSRERFGLTLDVFDDQKGEQSEKGGQPSVVRVAFSQHAMRIRNRPSLPPPEGAWPCHHPALSLLRPTSDASLTV